MHLHDTVEAQPPLHTNYPGDIVKAVSQRNGGTFGSIKKSPCKREVLHFSNKGCSHVTYLRNRSRTDPEFSHWT